MSVRLDTLATALLTLVLPLLACSNKHDNNKGPGPDPDPDPDPESDPFWLVGDEGNMFGVTQGGEASTYPLEHDEDLLAIACLGQRSAWVVGTGGTVLRSRDAGATWDTIDPGLADASVDWTALAVAEATPEGVEALWLVGREGAIVHTPDGGSTWVEVAGPARDFTSVATEVEGNEAVAVADDGSIWQLSETGASWVHDAGAPLHGLSMSTHDGHLVAVGEGGLMLRSEHGQAWAHIELPTSHDLYAVRVSAHTDLAVAVGEAGTVVRVERGVATVAQLADLAVGLHGLHLRDDGYGQAVGEAGTLLRTSDAGLSWEPISLATTATLRGVDDFHGGHL